QVACQPSFVHCARLAVPGRSLVASSSICPRALPPPNCRETHHSLVPRDRLLSFRIPGVPLFCLPHQVRVTSHSYSTPLNHYATTSQGRQIAVQKHLLPLLSIVCHLRKVTVPVDGTSSGRAVSSFFSPRLVA